MTAVFRWTFFTVRSRSSSGCFLCAAGLAGPRRGVPDRGGRPCRRGCGAAPPVRERLLAEAGGNLLELPRALSPGQLEGRTALPEAIPLSPQLEGCSGSGSLSQLPPAAVRGRTLGH
jgi:hypothetical protein